MKENKFKILIVLLVTILVILLSKAVFATEQEENTKLIPTVSYRTHVQDVGWQNYVQNGEVAGTSGQSKRLEGINIKLLNNDNKIDIKYQVHVQNIGWQEWKKNDDMAGTTGQSLRLEAIQIEIIENPKVAMVSIENPIINSKHYSLQETNISVSGWRMSNSENANLKIYLDNKEIDTNIISYVSRQDIIEKYTKYGTAEQNPLPGYKFEIDTSGLSDGKHILVAKVFDGENVLSETSTYFYYDSKIYIQYKAHVQDIGWQDWKKNEELIGTTGQSKRIEAVQIKLLNVPEGAHVKYRVHIQDVGWQDWKKDGGIAGTTGQSKRIEAIQIKIEGMDGYTVEYLSHVENVGWQQWASDEMISGTVSQSLRVEALKIRIVKSKNTIVPQIKYSNYITSQGGWSSYFKNGAMAGSDTSGIKIEALKIALENVPCGKSVKYKVHSANIGWLDNVSNNEQAGVTETNKAIEAVTINLEGLSGYSVEYRVYVNGIGWKDWTRDGKIAGTVGESKQIGAIQIRLNIDAYPHNNSSYENINTAKYPGYKERLDRLQAIHPTWTFKLLYTGLTFDEAIRGEHAVHSRNLVPSSHSGEWICSVCGTRLYDSGWYCASEKAIAYYMDSRNFLDETNVFQFLDLNSYNSDSASLSGIQTKVNGSFLHNYADAINNACRNTNVNPYYIIARLIQEQGYSGTRIGTGMDGGNGRTYYNPFNIGASGNGYDAIYANALATAKANGWDTMQKAIEGGISFCKKNWLENYQNTLYQNKFDIDSTNRTVLYAHQYMQNLMGAYSEARTLRSMYANTSKLDSKFTFIIPVYEGMSSTLYEQPSYNSETTPINVRVTANGGLNLRSDANTNSSTIRTIAQGEVILSVQRGINSNWQKVVLNDGTIGYMSGTYLQQVSDVTNCNYSAYVKTSDGSGCYIRGGPSTKLDRITALSDGTWLTVINEGTYNNIDGYNWVRVLLSDGRQAFLPSKYLSR